MRISKNSSNPITNLVFKKNMDFFKVCIIGPSCCGKSKLISVANGKFNKYHKYVPTLGFNIELVRVGNDFIKVYEFSGDEKYTEECLKIIKDLDFVIVFEGYDSRYQEIIDNYDHVNIRSNENLDIFIFRKILKFLEF